MFAGQGALSKNTARSYKGGEELRAAKDGTPAVRASEEDPRESRRDLLRHLEERSHLARPGGALDFEIVSQVMVEALQRLDQ